jgi:hypothetical protein
LRLLEANPTKIIWSQLLSNPSAIHLFTKLNYSKMRDCWEPFCKEVVEYVLNPLRLTRMASLFDLDLEEYLELI